jgi:hypothetical protein
MDACDAIVSLYVLASVEMEGMMGGKSTSTCLQLWSMCPVIASHIYNHLHVQSATKLHVILAFSRPSVTGPLSLDDDS